MFEDRTYEAIIEECLANAPNGVDTRQGSIFFDAVSSAAIKIAQYYADLRTVFDLVFLPTAEGEYLDQKGSEFMVFRNPATSARYEFIWAGATEPLPGARFFADGLYFTLQRDPDPEIGLHLEAETTGSASNYILSGTPAIPVNNISGLTSASFGVLVEPGGDTESDDNFRERIQEKIAGPAENGNRQHYKTWCESIPGVARARIIPLFAGENTVMGVLIGMDGLPAAPTVVERVQEYIDPMTLGITVDVANETIPVGDGLGDGVANIGAHFAAVAPARVNIDVSFAAELRAGATLAQIKADAEVAVTAYLKELALTTPERLNVIVRISAITSFLYNIPGLLDYSDLTLNGVSSNIELTVRQIAALGEVSVSAIV